MYQKISEAPIVWRLLNGVICVYKPAGVHVFRVRKTLITNLTNELCQMDCRPPIDYVRIEGDTTKEMSVEVHPSYADHPLVVGPRYQTRDLRCVWATFLGKDTSGVFVIGLGNGVKKVMELNKNRPIRTYHVTGQLGFSTDNFFTSGKVVEKSTFKHVRKDKVDRITMAFQASHQKKMFEVAGVEPGSQEAYDLAVKGFIRATDKNIPMVYGLKCIQFSPPNFVLEIQCVNENEMYLKELIHEIGLKLHSNAVCSGIQCVRHSYFTVKDALLRKHWTLQHVLDNLIANRNIIDSHVTGKNIINLSNEVRENIDNV